MEAFRSSCGRAARLGLLLVSLGGLGCSDPRARPAARAAAISVVDDLGRAVTLDAPARRIAALSPANTETLFALGCGGRVVLRDRASDVPAAARRLPATDAFNLSPDHIAGFRPDLVLLSHADAGRLTALARIGLTAASFDPRTLEQLLLTIRAIGALCGASRQAATQVAALRRRIDDVRRRVRGRPRPSVYVELDGADPARPWTAGRGSFIDELIRLAGGRSITAELPHAAAQIGAEAILRSDPRVVLFAGAPRSRGGLARRLRERPGWGHLAALRDGRIIETIDPDLLSRPGPRLVDGLEQLAAALHPVRPAAPAAPDGAPPL